MLLPTHWDGNGETTALIKVNNGDIIELNYTGKTFFWTKQWPIELNIEEQWGCEYKWILFIFHKSTFIEGYFCVVNIAVQ